MQRFDRRLLLAFVPALLIFSACDSGAVSDTNVSNSPVAAATAVSPTPARLVKASPIAKPKPAVVKPKPAVASPYAAATAAGASAVCADGTWSFSAHRSGTCSHHGGVHWWTGNLGPAGPGGH